MALRVCHVPSIVSFRQLQEEAGASPTAADAPPCCSMMDGTTPLANAVGACMPLYQYPLAGMQASFSRSSSMAGSDADARVPDYLGCNSSEDVWNAKAVAEFIKPSDASHATMWSVSIADAAMTVPSEPQPHMVSTQHMVDLHSNNRTARTLNKPCWTSTLMHQITDASLLAGSVLSDEDAELIQSELADSASEHLTSSMSVEAHQTSRATIDTVLTSLWDDCNARGLFRYDVTACDSKVLPGPWGWVAQLNEGRASKKRPTELRVDAVLQPFDAAKFHFGKAYLHEVLFQFEPLSSPASCCKQTWSASTGGARMTESSSMTSDPTLVMINVSPIDYGHVLLTPRVLSKLPQQLEPYGLSTALAFVREVANPSFRLGFNSLGAYATINHLHFQGYYLDAVLPCERANTLPVPGFEHENIEVSVLADYPVRGWVVQHRQGVEHSTAELDMASILMQLCGHLQNSDQPFNVLFVDQGRRAFIWPQCYAERQAAGEVHEELLDTGVNPAVFEVAGHLVLKRAQDYATATDSWAQRLLTGVSLTQERFDGLTQAVFSKQPVQPTADMK